MDADSNGNVFDTINTGSHRGDNTDGLGLVRDLCRNQGFDLAGKRLLLLGAGGAMRPG